MKAQASRSTRRSRRLVVPAFLIVTAATFLLLAVLVHHTPVFAIDLAITRALQRIHQPEFAALMRGLSWLGFLPQAAWLGITVIVALFLVRMRREAVALGFAGISWMIVAWIKALVLRPRPRSDLVQVLNQLSDPSFPSGHVVTFTAFCGFLVYLVQTKLAPSWIRSLITVALALVIVAMGPSRIYLGHHWFSDVIGAYAFGSLWLALTIVLYVRMKR